MGRVLDPSEARGRLAAEDLLDAVGTPGELSAGAGSTNPAVWAAVTNGELTQTLGEVLG